MKKPLFLAALLAAALFCTGCSDVVEGIVNAAKAEGRVYGQTLELEEGDTMSTAFFDMTVNAATMLPALDGYIPNLESDRFLVVNITVTNTFGEAIPMSDADFELGYDGADETATIFPESEFATDQLPATYEIQQGGSQTGNLIYVVPADAEDFRIYYYDLWSDDFEGNTYWLPFSVSAQSTEMEAAL